MSGFCKVLLGILALLAAFGHAIAAEPSSRFRVSVAGELRAKPVTGRLIVIVTPRDSPEPRQQYAWLASPPMFGVDVDELRPGERAVIDETAPGYPVQGLRQLPPGDYYVQAVLNVYTRFRRSDGHTIWAHMDQWEGQRFDQSPGNLFSKPRKVRLDPRSGFDVTIELTEEMPPLAPPQDTQWIKHVKIESEMLTKFWGRSIPLGATVLLPKGYDEHPDVHYPVVYMHAHFGQRPFFFNEDPHSEARESALAASGMQTGYQFYRAWIGDDIPRFIVVTLHHPTPYSGSSYAVNSANSGPYADAIHEELLPHLENQFRMIRQPYARLLEGGSTGGWVALALQLYHPEYYGGSWIFNPDPVDFRNYQLVDIYSDENAFVSPQRRSAWIVQERPAERMPNGQVTVTLRQMARLEAVLGSKGRSGLQYGAWDAAFGPTGSGGYPEPLWDPLSGAINRSVATYMRDEGYDLRAYAEKNWSRIGPHLRGKLHFIASEMDNYYLNLAVYRFEEFLQQTLNPHVDATFIYGRPMKAHGWHPTNFVELLHEMAAHVREHAPPGESAAWVSY